MELNLWDFINCSIAAIITVLICYKFNFSSKVLYLLLLHVFLIFILDAFIAYTFMPDQRAYLWVSSDFRNSFLNLFGIGEQGAWSGYIGSDNINFASAIFAFFPFPVFIESIKSLAYFNYYLYLSLFLFLVLRIKHPGTQLRLKYFYFLYPSLIFYTCSGTRDIMILILMFIFLYAFLINFSFFLMAFALAILVCIKAQNALLVSLALIFYIILKVSNNALRRLWMICYLILLGVLPILFWDQLYYFRRAMFYEDTGLPVWYLPNWSLLDLYRVFFAPFFFDARNSMQMLQSFENLGMSIAVYKLYRYLKQIKADGKKLMTMNFFAIISALLYSFVVFNYGTLTRYKLPFLTCWFLVLLMLVDKRKQEMH